MPPKAKFKPALFFDISENTAHEDLEELDQAEIDKLAARRSGGQVRSLSMGLTQQRARTGGYASKGRHLRGNTLGSLDGLDGERRALPPGSVRLTDSTVVENVEVGKKLMRVPVLGALSPQELGILGGAVEEVSFSDQEDVVREGSTLNGFYIIIEGSAKCVRRDPKTRRMEVVCVLQQGDHFGEAARLNNPSRGLGVIAMGKLVAWFLNKSFLAHVFTSEVVFPRRLAITSEHSPQSPMAKNTSTRLRRDSFLSTQQPAQEKQDRKKNDATRAVLNEALSKMVIFTQTSEQQRDQVLAELWRIDVAQGAEIVKEGEIGAHLYLVEHGAFALKQDGQNGEEALTPGDYFGELALMHESARTFSVTAKKPFNTLWCIDRPSFRRILADVSTQIFQSHLDFLRNVEYLKQLSPNVLAKVVYLVDEEVHEAGKLLCAQGGVSENLWIIKRGEVHMVQIAPGGKPLSDTNLKEGDFFGESSLLEQPDAINTTMTVTALTEVTVLRLPRESCHLLLGPLKPVLQEVANDRKIKIEAGCSTRVVQWKEGRGKACIPRARLDVIGFLGKGSYGHVQLVRDTATKATYALKGVMKKEVVECNQMEHIVSEKRVMMALSHPFLVNLHATYKDKDCVYFLMEAAQGGELFNLLRATTILDNNTARFYAASVIIAFDYMHMNNIVYRDLKPENILLTSSGFCKVADFGFAKELMEEHSFRTFTLCGTPDYLAPEVILGTGHSFSFDWWCVGIFIYELLAGWPPFCDDTGDIMKTYEKIITGDMKFPKHLDLEAVNVISEFLQYKPTERLGSVGTGLARLKRHKWFQGFDWSGLEDQSMASPYNPKLKGDEDLSHFDPPEDGLLDREVEAWFPNGEEYPWEDEF